ncbi:MAG: neutral/alkaline non-lysosomal ceramidase N-terminal domain-containing protein, partial [Pirellulaceae bacterium]
MTKTTCLTICLFAVCCFVTLNLNAEDKPVFRAGAAIADITPPLGEKVVGSFSPFPATNIHDPLHARCLCLDDGETKLFFVICDNVGIAKSVYDEARAMIAEQSDIDAQHIVMAATHTHSACVATSPKYTPIIAKGITQAVLAAKANLQPARIGWSGIDDASELNNRRWYIKDPKLRHNPFGGVDTVRMNPPRNHPSLIQPAGPVDPEISFLSVQSTKGDPIALLANYSLHYVGGVPRGDVSADYFGVFANQIGPMIGAKPESPFVGILTNGTSADVNNIDFRFSSRDAKQTYGNYEKLTEVADKVAKKVAEAHANTKFHDWVPLATLRSDLTLKVRKPDEKMQAYFAGLKERTEVD